MDMLFEFCDLSVALEKIMAWARSIHGHTARMLSLWCAVLAVTFAALSWYFDVDSTHEWVSKAAGGLSQIGKLADYAQIILILVTVAPTLLRQTLAGPARQGLKLASFMFFAVGVFDLQTDWPRVKVFCDAIYPLFNMFGALQDVIWYVFRAAFVLVATDGFELLTIACAAAAVVLLRDKQ